MTYLDDLYGYLGQSRQTLAGLVAALRPAVGELNGDLAAIPQVALLTIAYDDPRQVMNLDSAAVILDAKVYLRVGFNAGTSNAITFATGAANILGGGNKVTFANAYDVTGQGGTPVTGFTVFGTDTPQILPVLIGPNTAVFIGYTGTGTAATQGKAVVAVTYLPAGRRP